MATSSHQIRCINKREHYNPYQRITHVGGQNPNGNNWKLAADEAIQGIETGKWSFHITRGGHTVAVKVAVSRFGNKYLKTEADNETPDNLLSLYECVY